MNFYKLRMFPLWGDCNTMYRNFSLPPPTLSITISPRQNHLNQITKDEKTLLMAGLNPVPLSYQYSHAESAVFEGKNIIFVYSFTETRERGERQRGDRGKRGERENLRWTKTDEIFETINILVEFYVGVYMCLCVCVVHVVLAQQKLLSLSVFRVEKEKRKRNFFATRGWFSIITVSTLERLSWTSSGFSQHRILLNHPWN